MMRQKMAGLCALALGALAFAAPAPADTVRVSDDLIIYYETAGSGDTTVLFVPGLGMSTRVFERQLEAFEGSTEYTFVTYDPRGQGLSSKTIEGHYYEQHGRDLDAFIKALKLDNIVLGGWSYGGLDVLAYVDQFGFDGLKGFVMIDATPKSRGHDNATEFVWYRYDDADGFEAYFTKGPLQDYDELAVGFADWMLADKSEANMQFAIDIIKQTPAPVMSLLNATAALTDYTETLVAMDGKLPLLFVVRKDWGEVVSGWVKENTPSARVSASMVSHLGFWEEPAVFNAEIDSFLESIKN